MKLISLFFAVIAYTFVRPISANPECDRFRGDDHIYTRCMNEIDNKQRGRRRRLADTDRVTGPCAAFPFVSSNKTKNTPDKCKAHPELNPDTITKPEFYLSKFAHDWIDYTCCQIITEPLNGIISSVWLWLQVCTKTMNTLQADSAKLLLQDVKFAENRDKDMLNKAQIYPDGPLKTMKRYCPQDLDGGELSEWVVTTFFPVMERYNQNFHSLSKPADKAATCKVDKAKTGAATVILQKGREGSGEFGHIAMVLHEDDDLILPQDWDTEHFVSFNNVGNTIGAMITGTKAAYDGFGKDLENMTHVATLYNVDTDAMKTKWKSIKGSGQMFDLMEWNCARTVLEVLKEGYTKCDFDFEILWTPSRAFDFIKEIKKLNVDAPTEEVELKDIQSRQIVTSTTNNSDGGIPVALVVAVALSCFFGTLVLALIIGGILLMKFKADAAANLDQRLANLLISAAAGGGKKPGLEKGSTASKYATEEPKEALLGKKSAKKNSVAPDICSSIQEQMDTGDHDGQTDFDEFSVWAKEHNLSAKQAKIMWRDLDRNHDKHVTSVEWEEYIRKRPNLKWLVTRLQSVRR